MSTINISLPTQMYKDAKAMLGKRGYSSISELIRDALRTTLYPHLTVNGFTPEFEEEILKHENDPAVGVWETNEDVHKFFQDLRKKRQLHGKN